MGADREAVHPDLLRDYWSARRGALVSLVLPGLAILVAVFALRPRTPPVELFRSALYALPGLGLLALAGFMARAAAWYRRSSLVFYTRAAVPMRMRAWRSRTGALRVQLHRLSDGAMREAQIEILPQAPGWDSTGIGDEVVKVHLDEDLRGPVVVETARGILWPAPLSRRQNRVEGRLE